MKSLSYILLLAAASAGAQNLSTEITVDRTIVPAERAASRLSSVRPSILTSPVSPTRLHMTEYMEPGTVTRSSCVLAPAACADSFAVSPYRGYVGGGYFPVYNLALSAGYRIIQNADTRLGVWGQFDGLSYEAPDAGSYDDYDIRFKNNTGTAGVDFDHRFGSTGVLTASASYSYGRIVAPDRYCNGDHSLGMADVRAAWYARAGRVGYHVDAALHTFGFRMHCDDDPFWVPATPVHLPVEKGTELEYKLSAGLIVPLGANKGRAGLELGADMLSRPAGTVAVFREGAAAGASTYRDLNAADGGTLGVISATPYYAFGGATGANVRLGARIDISTGGEGKKFHIAPDVQLSYSAAGFAIFARAGGGEVLNTQRSLYDYCVFSPAGFLYERSHLPLTVDAGVNIGPFAGFSAGVFGGWARANDWLMPGINMLGLSTDYAMFIATDIKGGHAGVRAAYDYRSMVHVEASAEFAPQKPESGYYMWRDRAKTVVKASATVRPIERLALTLGYEWRGDRAFYMYGREDVTRISAGSVSDLSFGARYALTPALDIFARGDNLLGRRYRLLPYVPSQGVHGLVGASFKF